MAYFRAGMRLTEDHVLRVVRGLEWLKGAWAENLAHILEAHHRREAPLGREFYTDEEGHEHPGWLRESVDAIELPAGSWLVTVHAYYGIYVNNGTRNQAPNPFWDRAVFRTELEGDELLRRQTAEMFARAGMR